MKYQFLGVAVSSDGSMDEKSIYRLHSSKKNIGSGAKSVEEERDISEDEEAILWRGGDTNSSVGSET